jgi:predicted ATP-binding protein involved in virulence
MNPQLGDKAPQETPGILMIDELDIHLHPEWQRRILQVLSERFPLLQIFATSHSPLMIGGLKPEQVLLLSDGKVSHPQATYGQDANRVLEDVMEVGSRVDKVQEEIGLIFREIEDRQFEAARDRLSILKSEAPDLPEYVRAEALIRRVEVVGR